MDSSDTPKRAANFQSVWMRAHEKVASLEAARKKVDAEVMELEKRFNRIVDYLTGSHLRRQRARKMVSLSLAVAASSLACSLNPNVTGLSRHALSISMAVGIGSLAWTVYHLKDVWFVFDGFSKSSVLREMLLPVQGTSALPGVVPLTSASLEAIPGPSGMSDAALGSAETIEDDIPIPKEFLNETLPDEVVASISSNSRLHERKRARSII